MPTGKYLAKLAGAFAIGLASLVLAGVLFFFLIPLIVPVAFGSLFLIAVFIALWVIVYVSMIIGTAIVYLFRPMEISGEKKKYTMKEMRIREAGRREKGETRKG